MPAKRFARESDLSLTPREYALLRRLDTPQKIQAYLVALKQNFEHDGESCRTVREVIRSGRDWVPHWYKPAHWVAYWDVFSRPATKPRYARGAPDTWWYDRDKAAKLEQRG